MPIQAIVDDIKNKQDLIDTYADAARQVQQVIARFNGDVHRNANPNVFDLPALGGRPTTILKQYEIARDSVLDAVATADQAYDDAVKAIRKIDNQRAARQAMHDAKTQHKADVKRCLDALLEPLGAAAINERRVYGSQEIAVNFPAIKGIKELLPANHVPNAAIAEEVAKLHAKLSFLAQLEAKVREGHSMEEFRENAAISDLFRFGSMDKEGTLAELDRPLQGDDDIAAVNERWRLMRDTMQRADGVELASGYKLRMEVQGNKTIFKSSSTVTNSIWRVFQTGQQKAFGKDLALMMLAANPKNYMRLYGRNESVRSTMSTLLSKMPRFVALHTEVGFTGEDEKGALVDFWTGKASNLGKLVQLNNKLNDRVRNHREDKTVAYESTPQLAMAYAILTDPEINDKERDGLFNAYAQLLEKSDLSALLGTIEAEIAKLDIEIDNQGLDANNDSRKEKAQLSEVATRLTQEGVLQQVEKAADRIIKGRFWGLIGGVSEGSSSNIDKMIELLSLTSGDELQQGGHIHNWIGQGIREIGVNMMDRFFDKAFPLKMEGREDAINDFITKVSEHDDIDQEDLERFRDYLNASLVLVDHNGLANVPPAHPGEFEADEPPAPGAAH